MAVFPKHVTVYFYSLEPVSFFSGESKEFKAGAFPLDDVLQTIRKMDPAAEDYRIKEDLFGGETFCLVHDEGPAPILGAYYRDNLAKPIAEYKGEISELALRDGEALVDAAYAGFFPGDVVGLVRTSSKAPGFAKIGQWLTLLGGYGCALFALRDPNTLAQLDRFPTKLRSLVLRIRGNRIGAVEPYSNRVAEALRAANKVGGGRNDEVGIDIRAKTVKEQSAWASHIRQEIEGLIGVLPDFVEAKVKVGGVHKPIDLLRANIQRPVKVLLLDTKRIGPREAVEGLFDAYEQERASIEAAVEATRPKVANRDSSQSPG